MNNIANEYVRHFTISDELKKLPMVKNIWLRTNVCDGGNVRLWTNVCDERHVGFEKTFAMEEMFGYEKMLAKRKILPMNIKKRQQFIFQINKSAEE